MEIAPLACVRQLIAVHHRFHEFFNIKRNAVGAVRDGGPNRFGCIGTACDGLNQLVHLAVRETRDVNHFIESHLGQLRRGFTATRKHCESVSPRRIINEPLKNSRVLGSAQWRSSTTIKSVRNMEIVSSTDRIAPNVLSFRPWPSVRQNESPDHLRGARRGLGRRHDVLG